MIRFGVLLKPLQKQFHQSANMRYSNQFGVAAALILMAACFLPWTYYPDIDKIFTGFFSEHNQYGKPGKIIIFLALPIIVLLFVEKIWAKRVNLVIAVLLFAFCIKSFILYSACYRGICPDRKPGIYLVLIASAVLVITAVLPGMRLKDTSIPSGSVD